MPFALLIIGMLLIVVGFQDTYKQFGALVAADSASFIWFLVAIGAVGAVGYIKPLETPSRAVLALIMVSLFLGAVNKGGFFGKLTSGITSGTNAAIDPIGTSVQGGNSGVSSGGNGNTTSSVIQGISTAAELAAFL